MRRARSAALAVLLAGACAPAPQRTFSLGVKGPLGPRDEAAALSLGLDVSTEPAAGAAVESAADGGAGGVMADASVLRSLGARAAAEGKTGVFFLLPTPPRGRELVEYPEEWQALARAVRELQEMRPIIEAGAEEPSPFAAAPGVQTRCWRLRGRAYVVIVNSSAAPVRLEDAPLARSRALFEVRADPREILSACPGGGSCLEPGGALWLEGRPE